jgi:hypothetical protein
MNYQFSQFEVKQLDTKIWRYVTEVTALQVLQRNFSRITPIISQMLEGKEITTPDGKVCIRIKKL